MDSEAGKLFIGGLSWDTSEEMLRSYFSMFGDISEAEVVRDRITGRPRGFAFVGFSDDAVVDKVLQQEHTINGRHVEAKRALSRDEQHADSRGLYSNSVRNASSGGSLRTKKIFVGGLPPSLTEDGFRQYFETYGNVTDVVIMFDQSTQRPRGFGFISFDMEDAVDRVLHKTFHDLNGKQVEVKRALPKEANPGGSTARSFAAGGSRGGSGGSASGGSYQAYPGSGGSRGGSYEGRMDSGRLMQPPQNSAAAAAAAAFPPYGSSNYSATDYGYGSLSNGIGYGGYGGYGGPAGGYGAATGAAAYGNQGVSSVGHASGLPGGSRSSWNNQAPGGYGNMGFGNQAPWGGPGSAASGQSYGYGSYGGTSGDGSYCNPAGYGTVGSRPGAGQISNFGGLGNVEPLGAGGGGYMGGGCHDSKVPSWVSDRSPSNNLYGGGGYGVGQPRQPPQS